MDLRMYNQWCSLRRRKQSVTYTGLVHCHEPQAILEYLFEQVQKFIGSTNQNGDDMTSVMQVH